MNAATPPAETPLLQWQEDGQTCSARWRSERQLPPPAAVVLADDTWAANAAFGLATQGTALLWRGDFNNARHLLQALARRADRPPRNPPRTGSDLDDTPLARLLRHRQAQAHRATLLGQLLIPLQPDYQVPLRRAPDLRAACLEAWGEPADDRASVVSLRELLGLISAHEWRKNGVAVPALGSAAGDHNEPRIHPHYGVFSPVRGEYLQLVAQAPLPSGVQFALPPAQLQAWDVGCGTGVLAALLARRGVGSAQLPIVATDLDPRALVCAQDNLLRLGLQDRVRVLQADLFPPGQADLIVCNPPWLPLRPGSPLERAVYDEDGRMLLGFLNGLAAHLAPGGEGWLILSDLAVLLGLRTPDSLPQALAAAGLKVLGRLDAKPEHPKSRDRQDPLHRARAAECTTLWRLGRARNL